MGAAKRPLPGPDCGLDASSHPDHSDAAAPPRKRQRLRPTAPTGPAAPPGRPDPRVPPPSGRDLLSPLSDELLLRILSFLPLQHLLAVAPVSRRLYQLSCDSQLWKALYYARFVLPRALRIPGFRQAAAAPGPGGAGWGRRGVMSGGTGHKLHYSGRRALWADGRRGGVVVRDGGEGEEARNRRRRRKLGLGGEGAGEEQEEQEEEEEEEERTAAPVNWKRQYKIRYNWARGKCAVEELKLGGDEVEGEDGAGRMLVKVVEGVAVTADKLEGLRAWNLKSRSLIAQIGVGDRGSDASPSCIAVDESEFERGALDVALGFGDGSFGVWRLLTADRRLVRRYRHEKSSNGALIAMAFTYPYLLTATEAVLVSLYTFEVPRETAAAQVAAAPCEPETSGIESTDRQGTELLPAPYLLTSLDSHTSRPPLALSIRRAGKATVASVAYTFSTRRGWSIGIQDLHIHQSQPDTGIKSVPEIATTRIAYTTPVETGAVFSHTAASPTAPRTPHHHHRHGRQGVAPDPSSPLSSPSSSPSSSPETSTTSTPIATTPPTPPEPGPTTLCYSHPYLLATLPDNTLVLHLCTSTAASLSLSDGIRLWGHTSGVGDAEITARGKAVSVSARGEEMRVWELEGRAVASGGTGGGGGGGGGGGAGGGGGGGSGGGRSVQIRPWQAAGEEGKGVGGAGSLLRAGDPARDWDERRNWVGFDDEMVIVLKERRGARESLMVYDFT